MGVTYPWFVSLGRTSLLVGCLWGLSMLLPGLAQAQRAELRAQVLLDEGLVLSSEGRLEAAQLFFEQSVRVLPTAAALLELAVVHLKLGHVEAALEALAQLSRMTAHERLALVPWSTPAPEPLALVPWDS